MRVTMAAEREESLSMKTRRKKFHSCKSCFNRFDELIMRPFLIHNYDKELISKKDQFLELFMMEADTWEKAYVAEDYDPNEIEDSRSQRGHSIYNRITSAAVKRNTIMNARKSLANNPAGSPLISH